MDYQEKQTLKLERYQEQQSKAETQNDLDKLKNKKKVAVIASEAEV
mgnify:CR=1 FL=1